jgi:nickel-type superoxide dismutase maturation protease
MEPALVNGACWLVRRLRGYRAGDVVLLRHPLREHLLVVKRIVSCEVDGFWVQGDNPEMSDDSRAFGLVPRDLLVGRLVLRYRRAPRMHGR